MIITYSTTKSAVRMLFVLLAGLLMLIAITILITLVPLNSLGNIVVNRWEKYGINISAKSSWHLRPHLLESYTSKLTFDFDVEGMKINGHGEKCSFSFLKENVSFDTLTIDVTVDDAKQMKILLDKIISIAKQNTFSLKAESVTINIYSKNNDNQTYLAKEIALNDLELTKTSTSRRYNVSININDKENITFFAIQNNLNSVHQETSVAVESEDIKCFLNHNKNGGNLDCNVNNVLYLLADCGFEIENEILKNIFNNKLAINANFTTNNNETQAEGSLILGHSVGKLSSNKNTLNITIGTLGGNASNEKTTYDVDNDEQRKNKEILSMYGRNNEIIDKIKQKSAQKHTNVLAKIINLLYMEAIDNDFQVKTTIDKAFFNDNILQNININVSKKQGEPSISMAGTSFEFENSKSKFEIRPADEECEQFTFSGENLQDFTSVLGIQFINDKTTTNHYSVEGKLILRTGLISIQDTELKIDGQKVLRLDYTNGYDDIKKHFASNTKLILQNIDVAKLLNMSYFYKSLYDDFEMFQEQKQQEAIFLQRFLARSKRLTENSDHRLLFIIENAIFENRKIDSFTLELNDSPKFVELAINSDSAMLTGSMNFNLKNKDNKAYIEGNIEVDNLSFPNFEVGKHVSETTGKTLEQIFLSDKDYNIPSLIGLNGLINVNVKNLQTQKDVFLSNVRGNILINDGIFETTNLTGEHSNGSFTTNATLSLRGIPQLGAGIVLSGIDTQKIINSDLHGTSFVQAEMHSSGFNPQLFVKNISGKGKYVIQNFEIPKFNLQAISIETIKNGINKNTNYESLAAKGNIKFPQAEGEFTAENGILRGSLSMSTELVSGTATFEYLPFKGLIKQLSGIFAVIITRNKLETPINIYIPYACNENIHNPSCLVDWKQLNDVIASV